MEKSSSEDSSIHRSPSLDSKDSDFAKPSTSGRPFGRGFTAGAFYGTAAGSHRDRGQNQSRAEASVKTDKYHAPKGSKYVVFYLDLSFVFLLEFKKCNMARGCLCCLKYMMFLFNLIFWVSPGRASLSLLLALLSLVLFFTSSMLSSEHAIRTSSPWSGAALLCALAQS